MAGLVTVVVVGADWFWRVILLLPDGFSTLFCGVTRLLLIGVGAVGLLVGAEGVTEEEPPPPLVVYWAAMLS